MSNVKRVTPRGATMDSKREQSYRLLQLAENCGARITGKPDGSEPVMVEFTPAAWQAFDVALHPQITKDTGAPIIAIPQYPQEVSEETLMDIKAKIQEMRSALERMAGDVRFIRANQKY